MSNENSSSNQYKDTLFLPKTEFSMKANLNSLEPEILNYWNSINLRQKMKIE